MEQTLKPALRFKGFNDTWELCKLGTIGSTFTGLSGKTKEDFGHGEARFVTYMNVFSNPISNPEIVESVEIDNSQNQVQKGDVFFTTSSETPEEVGMSSVWLNSAENTYLNSFCFGYRPTIIFNPYFLGSMLRSPSIRQDIVLLAQGISRYNISKSKVMDIEVPIPNLQEQAKIGDMFRSIDSLITLHQRKYDKLINVKKALLDKMFPKNGELTPRLRFKGFTDTWEQRKLSDLCSMNARIGWQNLRTSEFLDEGDYYLITGTDFEDGRINLETCHYIDKDRFNQDQKIQIQKGNILITKDGTLGKVAYVDKLDKPATLNAGVFNVRVTEKKTNSLYLFHYLKAPFLMKYAQEKSTGGTIKHLNQNILVDFPVCIPNLDEQVKIGLVLERIDNLITLNKCKYEKLVNIKKALLQKMFV